MTLFTEGRLQAYERMMRDNGNYHRGRSDGRSHRIDSGKNGANSSRKGFGKADKSRTNARKKQLHDKPELSFLIDVRAKMQEGKGAGYARWAKVFNLKQMAKALMFMEEHGIKSYEELVMCWLSAVLRRRHLTSIS